LHFIDVVVVIIKVPAFVVDVVFIPFILSTSAPHASIFVLVTIGYPCTGLLVLIVLVWVQVWHLLQLAKVSIESKIIIVFIFKFN
jgi:hypothetical protein